MKSFNQNAVIRGAIRRTFARAPVKQEVLKVVRKEFPKYNKDGSRSKKDAVCYLCAVCKEYKGSTKVTVDHIEPVISLTEGFVSWDEFVNRLYCGKENLQVICDDCHQIKTNKERFERTMRKEWEQIEGLINKARGYDTYDYSKDEMKFIKKFTHKRIHKYPQQFVQDALYLRLKAGLKH